MSYCFATVCCALLTLLTLTPPLIPVDWARLDANGVYLPKVVEAAWPSYGLQVALWLGIVVGLLWGRRRLKDLRLCFWKSSKEDWTFGCPPPLQLWMLMLITLLGFGLRAYALQSLPLIIDEIGFAAHASDILHGQHVPIFAPGHNANPSMYSWLLAGTMGMFGQNVFAIRLLPLFFGTLSIPAAYCLGRAWYSRRVGLIAAAFLATYPVHVFNSRLSLYDIADPLFALLALAFLVRGFRKHVRARHASPLHHHPIDFVYAGIFAACGQYFYHGSRLLLVLMAFYTFIELGLNRRRWRAALPGLWRLGFAVIVLPLPIFVPRLVHGLPLTGNINPIKLPADLPENSLRAVLAWVNQPDVSPFWLSARPLLLLPALVTLLAGIVLLRPRDARYWTLLLSLPLTTLFGGVILTAAPLYVRYIVALPAMVLLVGVGIDRIASLHIPILLRTRHAVSLQGREGEKGGGTGMIHHAPTEREQISGRGLIQIGIVAVICIQGVWVSLQHPSEAQSNITASQWQEHSLAQEAATLSPTTSVVLVVPPEFDGVQQITVAHMVAAFGERRALAVNLSQATRLQAQMRLLPGIPVVLRVK